MTLPGDIAFDPEATQTRTLPPEFPESLRWIDRGAAVRLADLRGSLVLVVFWNGTSATSENLWSGLRVLRDKYPGHFALLGVHTPRYATQQADAAVRHALRRTRLRVPVANDRDWAAWRRYGITAWPTTLVIDGEGRLAARFVGEGRVGEIEDVLQRLHHGAPGAPGPGDRPANDAANGEGGEALAYPAHALATATRLYVSDTGHHRVLECALDGRVLRRFGSGTPGSFDGAPATCGFHSPRGLACDGSSLYVADTGNHSVRRIHLDTGDVETVIGTGAAPDAASVPEVKDLRDAINAPYAVTAENDVLHIAAAGQHQILRADLRTQRMFALAGDGRYDVRDGIGGQASLAQPGAIAFAPGQLLVADSGGNAIRRLRVADLALTTLAGGSPWEPGCTDGIGKDVRLAFPGGLAVGGDRVYVADTCNNRLCTLDPYSGRLATLPLERPLHAPLGLSFAHDALWVADCEDHAILKVSPDGGACERIAIAEEGLE